ncbi:MAG: Dihydroneopterin aldolase [Betaproteobacteria bacterium ADurb.Bin341]|nr:MAG: Dihydroneopterin aldolase [Betaproteobacteria bacterium ADurb.Bin341]
MDIIFIEELRTEARVGVHPREQALPQPIEISLEIGVNTTSAGTRDDLGDTVDYASVVARLREELTRCHFRLLETLAEHLAQLLLREFACQRVKISVAKIGILAGVRRVGVKIERQRSI